MKDVKKSNSNNVNLVGESGNISVPASSADVASSSSSKDGFLTIARAIAMRCFCPPLSCTPLSPEIEKALCVSKRKCQITRV